jgi:DNA-binding CsgD family transcriptional regulator
LKYFKLKISAFALFFIKLLYICTNKLLQNKNNNIMSIKRNLKTEIVQMRTEGKSYREIQKILNCSRGTINYHCKNTGMVDTGKKVYALDNDMKRSIAEYCKTHSLVATAKAFKLSISTINNYKNYTQEQPVTAE